MNNPNLASLSEAELQAQAWHDLPVDLLCKMCNPLGSWSELERPITRKEVKQCIIEGREKLTETPLWTALIRTPESKRPTPEVLRDNHIRKIGWFVVHGTSEPIDLDVGVPSLGCWVDHVVEDGHHRLAGAMIRGDKTIPARVSGATDHAQTLGLWNPNLFEDELQRRYDQEQEQPTRQPPKP